MWALRSQLCGCQLLQLPHTLAHTGSLGAGQLAAVDRDGPLLPPGGHCHYGSSFWASSAWGPLSPAQVVGTSRLLGAPCPPLAWSFSHLTGPGDGEPGQEMPGLHLRASLQEGSCHPWHCITCSTWEHRQPSQLSHRRGLPVGPSHSVTWFISNIQMYSSLGTPSLRG